MLPNQHAAAATLRREAQRNGRCGQQSEPGGVEKRAWGVWIRITQEGGTAGTKWPNVREGTRESREKRRTQILCALQTFEMTGTGSFGLLIVPNLHRITKH